MADTVLIERDGPIVTVVLNRPEKLNAIDKVTWIALGDAIGGTILPEWLLLLH